MPSPPPEITNTIPDVKEYRWFPQPILPSPDRKHDLVDVNASQLLAPFLENPLLQGSLGMMDLLNGCYRQCDTCLADAPLPTKIFTLDSIVSLFNDYRFLNLLNPRSLTIGVTSDLLNHPNGVKIAQIILQKLVTPTNDHRVWILTNYRPADESNLSGLIELAMTDRRLGLVISLPLNRFDNINIAFLRFIKMYPAIFANHYKTIGDLPVFTLGATNYPNIMINDVRHASQLYMMGRILPRNILNEKIPPNQQISPIATMIRIREFSYRGSAELYFNPDALWLRVAVTPYESHTCQVYTPLTPDKIDNLCQIPYNPDVPLPPNWRGGQKRRLTPQDANIMKKEAMAQGLVPKPPRIVPK